jgi:hypothetical protein
MRCSTRACARTSLEGVSRLLLALPVLLVAAAPAAAGVRSFHSPSGNIQCELDWQRAGVPNRAYCQTFEPARSVAMNRTGGLRICRGVGCLGNGPENAFTLRYGHATRLGPFRCLSLASGMRCTVPSGHGFLLSRSGVKRLP